MDQLDQLNPYPEKPHKIYPVKAIAAGTFFGGPMVAGYMLSENYRALNQKENVIGTWVIAVVCTIALFAVIFMIPALEKIPNQIFPLFNAVLVFLVAEKIQGKSIKLHLSEGGKTFSGWRSFGVSVFWTVITVGGVFAYAYLSDPVLSSTHKTYGKLSHEIHYPPTTVPETEVDAMAHALTEAGFFDQEQQKFVFLQKANATYTVSIPLVADAWLDTEVIDYFAYIRADVQKLYPANPVILNLSTEEDITDVKKVLN
jgi:hypothetical protein